MKKTLVIMTAVLLMAAALASCGKKEYYSSSDFGFNDAKSSGDYNGNGKDDYADFVIGARKDAEKKPTYDDSYFEEGYPPDDIGVCADVIWRAFREAGYSLKDMVDRDIMARPTAYRNIKERDPNIDFRRVTNLRIFFTKYARSLTTDIDDIAAWQPGDIVVFNDDAHIGIVSDKRNKDGRPYILHNGGQPVREEDYLGRSKVSGHYRFDASNIPEEVLASFEE